MFWWWYFFSKQTRSPFPHVAFRIVKCYELIHMDVWGNFPTPTIDGKRFFLTLVDDYSRAIWVYLVINLNVLTFYNPFMPWLWINLNKLSWLLDQIMKVIFFQERWKIFYLSKVSFIIPFVLTHPNRMGWLRGSINIYILNVARALQMQCSLPTNL